MRLSVISPTLNEAENVPQLVDQLGHALRDIDYEILIVDDNSPDRTWRVAQEISSTNSRVRVIRRMQNPGLGEAVIDGFLAATGEVVACIDADLQHDPSILPRMIEELQGGADVVVGSRHVEGGSTGEWDWFRRLQSWLATRIVQFLLGIQLKDPMSGYFLISRKNFCAVKDDLNAKGFKILMEILARLNHSQVKEVPYTFRPRARGLSKLSSRVILQYFHQVWRLCSTSRHHSVRFLKSAVVGGVGVLINLSVMALLLKLTKIHNWRASAIASLAANAQNYVLFSAWSYVTDARKDFRKLQSYFSYLLTSAAGLVVSTVTYAGLAWTLALTPIVRNGAGITVFSIWLSCQLVAVLVGVWFNRTLIKISSLTQVVRPDLEVPEEFSTSAASAATTPSLVMIANTEEPPSKSPAALAAQAGK
jgi:dolichol-phosphate mannosyltransferase